jgi:hypothetical protein
MPPANGYSHAVVASGPLSEQTATASERLTKATAHKLRGQVLHHWPASSAPR